MRQVRRYPTRELIPASDGTAGKCSLVVLSDYERVILRSILNYARRSINYLVSELGGGYYVALSDDDTEFNDIQYIVDELEYKLMVDCDISVKLDDVIEELASIGACVCKLARTAIGTVGASDAIDELGAIGLDTNDDEFDNDVSAVVNDNACLLARAVWAFIWEIHTETFFPNLDGLTDLTYLVVTTSSAFAFLTGLVSLPATAIAAIVAYLLNWVTSAVEADWTSAFYSCRDDFICALYSVYDAGGWDGRAAIDPVLVEAGFSTMERAVIKAMAGSKMAKGIKLSLDLGTFEPAIPDFNCSSCASAGDCFSFDPPVAISWLGTTLDADLTTLGATFPAGTQIVFSGTDLDNLSGVRVLGPSSSYIECSEVEAGVWAMDLGLGTGAYAVRPKRNSSGAVPEITQMCIVFT